MTAPLIQVDNLNVQFVTDEGLVTAVESTSFALKPGEILGLVGESGSGKSVTAKSLMQLNAKNTRYGEDSRITLNLTPVRFKYWDSPGLAICVLYVAGRYP